METEVGELGAVQFTVVFVLEVGFPAEIAHCTLGNCGVQPGIATLFKLVAVKVAVLVIAKVAVPEHA